MVPTGDTHSAPQMTSPILSNLASPDGVQIWERPWSTDEMRNHAADWSLAGDAGLLQYLQRFSQNMITQTHEMEKLMNNLSHEAKTTCSKVNNVINDFHMLSNTQFVESRVYDEEAQDSPVRTKPLEETKTKEQREAEVVLKISEALNFGLAVINEAFDHITEEQDSDDESPPQVFLKPKDKYAQRRLPFLIGSPQFLSDDFVGIADVTEKRPKEKIEIFESDDSEEEILDPGLTFPTFIPPQKPTAYVIDSDEDLFPNQEKDEDDISESSGPRDEPDKQTGPLPPQLLAQIIGNKNKIEKPKVGLLSDDEDLFGGADLPDDELFTQKRKGIFSSSTGAFKDKKEDDVVAEIPKKDKDVNLSDEDDGLFGGVKEPVHITEKLDRTSRSSVTSITPSIASTAKKTTTRGLFDSDEEDDMFSAPRKPSIASVKPPTPKIATKPVSPRTETLKPVASGLFDSDEEEGLFAAPPLASAVAPPMTVAPPQVSAPSRQQPKLPTGPVSLLGSIAGEIGAAIKSKRPKDSDSEEEDVVRPDSRFSNKSSSSLAKNKKESGSNSSNSLFNDEVDELFAARKDSVKPMVKSVTKDSLFGDEDEDDLFKPMPTIFSSEPKNLFVTNDVSEKPIQETKTLEKPSSPLKIEIAPETKKKVAPPKKVSLFDDEEEEDDDLFSFSSKQSQSPGSFASKNSESTPASNVSLIPEEPPETRSVRSTSLFDEDKLFVAATEESPEVDLFSEQKASAPDETDGGASPQKKPSIAPKVIGGVALFGGIDIFGEHLRKKQGSMDRDSDLFVDNDVHKERLLPTLKDSREVSVSFEEPVDTSNTLPSAAKDRVKVQVKRRPPSRKGRQVAKTLVNETSHEKEPSPAITEEKKVSLLNVVTQMRSPSTEEEDLFPVNEHLTNQLYVDSSQLPEKRYAREESVEDDSAIFDEDELFKKCAKSKIEDKNIFDDDDDDIFSTDLSKTVPVSAVTKTNSFQTKSPLSPDDEDIFGEDIFQSSTTTTAATKTLKMHAKSIFDEDDDDDSDIFASPSASSKEVKSSSALIRKKDSKKSLLPSTKDIFDDPLFSAQNE